MVHVIRHLKLPRRTFLRGLGATVAVPWLDSMWAALSRRPELPTRTVFVFAPNGKKMDEWTPAKTGTEFDLPYLLEPFAPLRKHITVYSRLDLDAAYAHGDGPGDHARASAAFLTCAHPRKTADVFVGASIDQVIAQARGDATTFRSLELGMSRGRRAGSCDSGYSCAYTNNISWATPTTPVAKEVHPQLAFDRLFRADLGTVAQAKVQRRRQRSILDVVTADANDLRRRIPPGDRHKLDEYLTAIREFETRMAKAGADASSRQRELPQRWSVDPRASYQQRLPLMYELIELALRTDSTRVVTFMLDNAGSNRSYDFIGVPEGHHSSSHHRGDPHKIEVIRKINRYHTEQFAAFLQRLERTREGDATLLDRSMIVYGSGIADGDRHTHRDLPILLAGGGNGGVRSGRHVAPLEGRPLADLYLGMLAALGIPAESFADSSGPLRL